MNRIIDWFDTGAIKPRTDATPNAGEPLDVVGKEPVIDRAEFKVVVRPEKSPIWGGVMGPDFYTWHLLRNGMFISSNGLLTYQKRENAEAAGSRFLDEIIARGLNRETQ